MEDEEKTRYACVDNPFAKLPEEADYSRLYRTGDKGYYLKNGDIICVSRGADGVEISGNRIEAVKGDGYAAPQTIDERLLAGIWSEVLGVKSVGITDNFFSIGGDSIKSIRDKFPDAGSGLWDIGKGHL